MDGVGKTPQVALNKNFSGISYRHGVVRMIPMEQHEQGLAVVPSPCIFLVIPTLASENKSVFLCCIDTLSTDCPLHPAVFPAFQDFCRDHGCSCPAEVLTLALYKMLFFHGLC